MTRYYSARTDDYFGYWDWAVGPPTGENGLAWWQAALAEAKWAPILGGDDRPLVFKACARVPCDQVVFNLAHNGDIVPTNGTTVLVSERIKRLLQNSADVTFEEIGITRAFCVPRDDAVTFESFTTWRGRFPIDEVLDRFEVPVPKLTWFALVCHWVEDLAETDRKQMYLFNPSPGRRKVWVSRDALKDCGIMWSRGFICTPEVLDLVEPFLGSPNWLVGTVDY